MKKQLFFASAAAIALLPFASCTNDDMPDIIEGDGVSIKVQLPSEIQSRQFSDGQSATELTYAVYESGKTTPLAVCPGENNTLGTTGKATFTNLVATINLKLADYKEYDIVFWAQNPDAPFTFNAEGQYVATDFAATKVNSDIYDAFTNHITVNNQGSAISQTVTLYRPFAQINIGTDDLKEAAAAALDVESVAVSAPSYTALNLMNTEVGSVADGKFVAASPTDPAGPAVVAYQSNTLPADETFPVSGYEYLSMNYLLVPSDKSTINVALTINGKEWKQFDNIPVQRNHRTNIYGSLLTNPAEFQVVIDPNFNTPDYDVDILWDGSVNVPEKAADGKYHIVDGANLAGLASICTSDNNYLQGETIVLDNDIDMGMRNTFKSIYNFSGTFDGNGHKVSGLPKPLFSTLRSTIKNLTVEGSTSSAILASGTNGDVVIENVTAEGNTKGFGAGGILKTGTQGTLTMTNCTNKVTVHDTSYAGGGFVGGKCSIVSTFTGCTNYGDITSTRSKQGKAGGFVGLGEAHATYTDCANYGNISASSKGSCVATGFLAWQNTTAEFHNCTNYGNIKTTTDGATEYNGAAGIAFTSGWNTGNWILDGCTNNGDITVVNVNYARENEYNLGACAGGIVATVNYATVEITGCTNNGKISAQSSGNPQKQYIGGIAGNIGWTDNFVFTNNVVNASTVLTGNQGVNSYISAYYTLIDSNKAETIEGNTNNTSYADTSN